MKVLRAANGERACITHAILWGGGRNVRESKPRLAHVQFLTRLVTGNESRPVPNLTPVSKASLPCTKCIARPRQSQE